MPLYKWSGLDSGYTHEYEQIKSLTAHVQKWTEEKGQKAHLMTNFYVGSEEIDAALVLPNCVVIIDLKIGSGNILGTENGIWYCIRNGKDFALNKNRKNPYIQARDKRFALINFLEGQKCNIFPSQKASQMDFYHTSCILLFDGEVQWDKHQLPSKVWPWFDVLSMCDITTKLEGIRTKAVYFNEYESWAIPKLLNLYSEDVHNTYSSEAEIHSYPSVIQDSVIHPYFVQHIQNDDSLPFQKLQKGFHERISGYFTGIDAAKNIVITTWNGEEYRVHLNDHFAGVWNDLDKLRNEQQRVIDKKELDINIINAELQDGEIYLRESLGSYFVIEPGWLINVTALTEFDFCPRSLLNNRFTINNQNEHMMRGAIVHEVFEDILKDPDDFETLRNKLSLSMENKGLQFSMLDSDPEEMKNGFLRDHLNALHRYRKDRNQVLYDIEKVYTERFIINPYLGLKGKVDAVVEHKDGYRAVELKTGKSQGPKAKPGHAFQVQAYALLMEEKYDTKTKIPQVIYSGNSSYERAKLGIDVEFEYNQKAKIINLRNKLVLADYLLYLDYEKVYPNKCAKCSQAKVCKNIYSLEIEHNENNLPLYHNDIKEDTYSKLEKEFFNKFTKLLTEEYRVIKEYQGTYFQRTAKERQKENKCVQIDDYEYDGHSYIFYCVNDSELREMEPCLVSDQYGPIQGECAEATITQVVHDSITVQTRAELNFEPRFLDAFSSESVFENNFSTLYEAITNKNLQTFRDIFIFEQPPDPNEHTKISCKDPLHSQQRLAIEYALGLKNCLLIQGPPGTGKTYTLARIVQNLYNRGIRSIISCYTHRAIDEVIEKIRVLNQSMNWKLPVYRLGAGDEAEDLQECRMLEATVNSSGELQGRIQTASDIIASCPIYIGTTHAWMSGRYDKLFKETEDGLYDVAVIDEASQAIITSTLGVMRLAKKFVLIGDHMQLPPVVQSGKAQELSKTLFETLYESEATPDSVKVMLNIQHRMPKAISDFVSEQFYAGKLNTSEKKLQEKVSLNIENTKYPEIFNSDKEIVLINSPGHPSANLPQGRKCSPSEAQVVVDLLEDFVVNQKKIWQIILEKIKR